MSHFYGTIQGSRGPATRCGDKRSGIRVAAQSFSGSVVVALSDHNGETWASIGITEGSSSWAGRGLYWGPLKDLFNLDSLLQAHAEKLLVEKARTLAHSSRATPESNPW